MRSTSGFRVLLAVAVPPEREEAGCAGDPAAALDQRIYPLRSAAGHVDGPRDSVVEHVGAGWSDATDTNAARIS